MGLFRREVGFVRDLTVSYYLLGFISIKRLKHFIIVIVIIITIVITITIVVLKTFIRELD